MHLCTNCQRARSKHDPRLIEQGLIECKPSEDPRVVISAFWIFAEQRACNVPFHIKASGLHKEAAWPLQFHADSIAQCEGYLANEGAAMHAVLLKGEN